MTAGDRFKEVNEYRKSFFADVIDKAKKVGPLGILLHYVRLTLHQVCGGGFRDLSVA
jgi:hypothetical protein